MTVFAILSVFLVPLQGGIAIAQEASALADNKAEPAEAPAPAKVRAVVPPIVAPFVDISPLWPTRVVEGINECKASMTCPTLLALKATHSETFAWVAGWCKARGGPNISNPDEKSVCAALLANSDHDLDLVSILTLARLAAVETPRECSGFGLTVPLYSIRYARGGSEVKGPVAAGLGGGYYWVPQVLCRESFSAGPEIAGYSEGLDPSGLFHLGLALGAQIAAYKYFQFGVAVGYDLYRRQPDSDAMTGTAAVEKSGLFDGSFHKSDWSLLITFSVSGATTSGGGR
jgi:hypothetical protein